MGISLQIIGWAVTIIPVLLMMDDFLRVISIATELGIYGAVPDMLRFKILMGMIIIILGVGLVGIGAIINRLPGPPVIRLWYRKDR